jgi:ABC-type glycerol-3-phosphate transport system substrate-binding protein
LSSSSQRLAIAICASALLGALAAGCGSSSGSSNTLTLYSAQHQRMTDALAKAFEKKAHSTVRIRFGEDEGLANQIVQ